jgi:hypothetical protein
MFPIHLAFIKSEGKVQDLRAHDKVGNYRKVTREHNKPAAQG